MRLHLDSLGERLDQSDRSSQLVNNSDIAEMTYTTFELEEESIEEVFANFTAVLYDCDELLDSDPNNDRVYIADAIELIDNLRQKKKKLIFTSNRSDKTRQQMVLKLKNLGINATVDEMFPTSYSTAVYLKAIDFERDVFVLGSDAIQEELHKMGIRCTGLCPPFASNEMSPLYAKYKLNPRVGAVVVGFDHTIPLAHLVKACSYATKPDCLFIVANFDECSADSDPGVQGSAIQVLANKGFISLGKPHKFYFNCIRQMHPNIDPKTTLIITDRLNADIAFGRINGIRTVFVESKNYFNQYNIQRIDRHYTPDYLADSLSSLAEIL